MAIADFLALRTTDVSMNPSKVIPWKVTWFNPYSGRVGTLIFWICTCVSPPVTRHSSPCYIVLSFPQVKVTLSRGGTIGPHTQVSKTFPGQRTMWYELGTSVSLLSWEIRSASSCMSEYKASRYLYPIKDGSASFSQVTALDGEKSAWTDSGTRKAPIKARDLFMSFVFCKLWNGTMNIENCG